MKDDIIKLRRGEPGDLSFIYRLEKQYIEDFEVDQIAKWNSNLECHISQWVSSLPRTTVAQHQAIAVGYLFWERTGETAELASVNVDPLYRRKGIALDLMRAFEAEARQVGCSVAKLGFVTDNPAQHLYERCGYQITGTKGRYLLMTKRL